MDYVYTIEGSGTQSLARQLTCEKILHSGDPFPEVKEGDTVYTTLRDPFLVGATWANRVMQSLNNHPRHDYQEMWFRQWKNWALNADRMTIIQIDDLVHHDNATGDGLGLKAAYDRGDMIYYHHFVPRHFIDFAQMCIKVAHG